MSLFKYGGEVSSNLLIVDSANIKFGEFFNRFDKSKLGEEEANLIKKIERITIREDVKQSVTMSDDRLIFIATKLMAKYPDAAPEAGLNEWFVVYEFLMRYYEKSLYKIDDIIRFINLWIGVHYASDEEMSPEQMRELVTIPATFDNAALLKSYHAILPPFVMEKITTGIKEDEIPESRMISYNLSVYKRKLNALIESLEKTQEITN